MMIIIIIIIIIIIMIMIITMINYFTSICPFESAKCGKEKI